MADARSAAWFAVLIFFSSAIAAVSWSITALLSLIVASAVDSAASAFRAEFFRCSM